MMNRLDPKFQAKLQDLVESGLGPDEIMQAFRDEDTKKALEEEEQVISFEEPIPEEIRVIAQALAYRQPEEGDFRSIFQLINSSYSPESEGGIESFRTGNCVTKESLEDLLVSSDYQWILVEAPGRSMDDSVPLLLALACFSTNGKSKRNGVIEGNLGSVRFFCVNPTYQKLFIGKRLLYKMEKTMLGNGCVRIMFSIPSPRERIGSWLEHQGYHVINKIPYPDKFLGHQLLGDREVMLNLYSKSLVDMRAQDKDPESTGLPQQSRNMHLPPHWRGIRSSSGAASDVIPVVTVCSSSVSGTEDGKALEEDVVIPDVD